MKISLTPKQEKLIKTQLQTGKYRNVEEVLETALKLLDEYDRFDAEWVANIKTKIDAAIATSENTPPIDGESFVHKIVAKFQQP